MFKIFRFLASACICFVAQDGFAQMSILTDASILRNFNKQQKFWAFGQTVQGNFHASKKETIYAWVSYYTNGKFKNNFTASPKNITDNPVPYTVYSSLRYRHISIGLKHYFIGTYDSEYSWNFYGYAGFGLLLGKADNRYSTSIDTSRYTVASPLPGSGAFKRLTLDAGIGTELPLGAAVKLYTELRTMIATSHYPSPYLLKSNYQLPSTAAVNLGIRVLME